MTKQPLKFSSALERAEQAERLLHEAESQIARMSAEFDEAQRAREDERQQWSARAAQMKGAEARAQSLLRDLERVKRRQEDELARHGRASERHALLPILDVRDNLERALASTPEDAQETPWVQGVRGVLHQLDDALTRRGITRIGQVGQTFDPTLHEAVGVIPAAHDQTPNTIAHVQRSGFVFEEGELIRPAQVVVAR